MGPVMHSTHRFRKKRWCIRVAFHVLKKGIFKHVNIQSFVDPNPIEFNMSKIWTLTRFVEKIFPTNFIHVFGFQQIPFKHLFGNLLKKVSDKFYTHYLIKSNALFFDGSKRLSINMIMISLLLVRALSYQAAL